MKRNDLLLILFVLVTAGLWYVIGLHGGREVSFGEVHIFVDGTETDVLPLNQDTALTVTGYGGNTCLVNITSGRADVTEASCPDKLCVHQKSISRSGETIVCLPARIVIEVQAGTDRGILEYDAVSE